MAIYSELMHLLYQSSVRHSEVINVVA